MRLRTSTLVSSLALATALVLPATRARAQALNGTGSFALGTGTISSGTGTTTVTVNNPQTVINWDMSSVGNNVFQGSGTTATFQNQPGAGEFAVLNRISPFDGAAPVSMNGHVISQLQNLASGPTRGGTIFFFSPSGILVGSNALFDVGSLGLTSSDIDFGSGSWIDASGKIKFTGAAAGTAVTTLAGSQINAPNAGSYVAIVAPRVEHDGATSVNGSAALVGAEAATITFSPSGLFDIQVDSGTTDNVGVQVGGTGSITGPAGNSGTGDYHRAYLIAVSKNSALTMALAAGSTLGFDIAAAADVVGNTVVLSGGHDVVGGDVGGLSAGGTGRNDANINSTSMTSALRAVTNHNLGLGSGVSSNFASDVRLTAPGIIDVFAINGAKVTIAGNASFNADAAAAAPGQSATAGKIWLLPQNGGSLDFLGNLSLQAAATGGAPAGAGSAGGSATGGTILLQPFNGGSLSVAGNVSADVEAFGIGGGTGTGGSITLQNIGTPSSLTISGTTSLTARGFGGWSSDPAVNAGIGTGGSITLESGAGSSMVLAGDLHAGTNGQGGSPSAAGVNAGAGIGGTIRVNTFGAGASLTLAGATTLSASGLGGLGNGVECLSCDGLGGAGTGGDIRVFSPTGAGSRLSIAALGMTASGQGGESASGAGATGTGGTLLVASGSGTALGISGGLAMAADGDGGAGTTGDGGKGTGGSATLQSDGGATDNTLTLGGLVQQSAAGRGGTALSIGTGGAGVGGIAASFLFSGTVQFSATVTADAGGTGGDAAAGRGGDGSGGQALFEALGSGTAAVGLFLTAPGTGGAGAIGGAALGGTSLLVSQSSLSASSAALDASASGGIGHQGAGGAAKGGLAEIRADQGGSLSITSDAQGAATLAVDAAGGDTYAENGLAGAGTGGTARVAALHGGQVGIPFSLVATATGAGGLLFGFGGTGGVGRGGDIQLQSFFGGSSLSIGSSLLVTEGHGGAPGGDCISCAGVGGDGFGGTVFISTQLDPLVPGSGNNSISLGFTAASSDGMGGNGANWVDSGNIAHSGPGGAGHGGTSLAVAVGGGTITTGAIAFTARGSGGAQAGGGSGGDGIGGRAGINVNPTGGTVTVDGGVSLDASGLGGQAFFTLGGTGGNGFGGAAELFTQAGTLTVNGDTANVAEGRGGAAAGGTGGLGRSGRAALTSIGGRLDIAGVGGVGGNVLLNARAFGGDGDVGGAADNRDPALTGTAGWAEIFARSGTVTVAGTVTADASAFGGSANGSSRVIGGGRGGDAFGGWAGMTTGPNATNGPSQIHVHDALLVANAQGGDGGAGLDGSSGTNGGNGGDAVAGLVRALGTANNGTLVGGNVSGSAQGFGGLGGNGGNGATGVAGDAGAGGAATGGNIQIGTASGNPAIASNTGSGTYASITADTSAFGGAGGTGGPSGSGGGNGGNGGSAAGGQSILLVRGSPVTVGSVNLAASATGGGGGQPGAGTGGNGGAATSGVIGIVATDRFQHPEFRGSLSAGAITGTALATGGNGFVAGADLVGGGSAIDLRGADATVDSLGVTIGGSGGGVPATADLLSFDNGTLSVSNGFSWTTGNLLAVYGSNSALTASSFALNAFDMTAPPLAPAVPGAISSPAISVTSGGNIVFAANLSTPSALTLTAPGGIQLLDAAGAGIALTAGSGSIVTADMTSTASLSASATSGAVTTANLAGNGPIDLSAGTGITTADISATGKVTLTTLAGNISVGHVLTGGDFLATAPGSFSALGMTAQGSSIVDIATGTDLILGALIAGGAVTLDAGGTLSFTSLSSGEDVAITTGGGTGGGAITAGNFIHMNAGGAVSLGALDAGKSAPSSASGATFDVALNGSGVTTGSIAAAGPVSLLSSAALQTGDIASGGDVVVRGSGPTLLGNVSGAALDLTGGGLATGKLTGTGAVGAHALSGTALTVGNVSSGTTTILTGGSGLTADSINSPGAVTLSTGNGSILVGAVTTGATLTVHAPIDFTSQGVTAAGAVDLSANGALTTGFIASAQNVTVTAGGSAQTGAVSGATLTLAGASLTSGNLGASGNVAATANSGALNVGNVASGGTTTLTGGTGSTIGNISSSGQVALVTSSGSILVGAVNTGAALDVSAPQNFAAGAVNAGGPVKLVAGGTATIGAVSTQGALTMAAGGSLTTGNLSSGGSVALQGAGVATGAASAATTLTMVSSADLATGNLAGSGGVLLLAHGNVGTGSITTGAGTQFLIADSSAATAGGPIAGFNPAAVLASTTLTRTAGSVAIGGAVSTGLVRAFAGTGFSAGAINASNRLIVATGGLASVGGIWSSPSIRIASDDIDIAAAGRIDGGLNGTVSLLSTNATQALIGDGLSGSGYALSNAEFGRVHAGTVNVLGRGDAAAPQAMLIGDLTITGPDAGSTTDAPNGSVNFATGDLASQAPGGILRVVGKVRATGFRPTNELGFAAGTFEVDASRGSIWVEGTGGALGGELAITAPKIYVATAPLLAKLEADPHFTNYIQELNAAQATPLIDPVLKADSFYADTRSLMIQNMGTRTAPIGFLFTVGNIDVDPNSLPANSIELVVNGQGSTPTGIVSGVDAWKLLLSSSNVDLTPFTPESQLNACLFTATSCGVTVSDPVPGIGDAIVFTQGPLLDNQAMSGGPSGLGEDLPGGSLSPSDEVAGDPQSEEERRAAEQVSEEQAQAPISPPQTLVDTRPLSPDQDVNDPVSGSGNQALIGKPGKGK